MLVIGMVSYDLWSGGLFNKRPVASLSVDRRVVFLGGAFIFDGAGSADPDGSVRTYVWDFGDGINPQTGDPMTTHSYRWAGVFNASVTVVDEHGASSEPVREALLVVPLPVESATDALTGQNISFSVDTTALKNAPAVFAWSFSDGTPPSVGATFGHSFADDGTYDVTLEATYMASSARAYLQVTVLDRPPTASISAGLANRHFTNSQITFDATASRDPDGIVTEWSWDFGDGATYNASDPIARHEYSLSGLFNVTLKVTDDDGSNATASEQVLVAKDLVITGFNATLSNGSDGRILANVTVEFANPGDAKAAGTVSVNVTSYPADGQPPRGHSGGNLRTGYCGAPVYQGSTGLSILVTGVAADGDLPEQTWYWVELAFAGNTTDSGWYQGDR